MARAPAEGAADRADEVKEESGSAEALEPAPESPATPPRIARLPGPPVVAQPVVEASPQNIDFDAEEARAQRRRDRDYRRRRRRGFFCFAPTVAALVTISPFIGKSRRDVSETDGAWAKSRCTLSLKSVEDCEYCAAQPAAPCTQNHCDGGGAAPCAEVSAGELHRFDLAGGTFGKTRCSADRLLNVTLTDQKCEPPGQVSDSPQRVDCWLNTKTCELTAVEPDSSSDRTKSAVAFFTWALLFAAFYVILLLSALVEARRDYLERIEDGDESVYVPPRAEVLETSGRSTGMGWYVDESRKSTRRSPRQDNAAGLDWSNWSAATPRSNAGAAPAPAPAPAPAAGGASPRRESESATPPRESGGASPEAQDSADLEDPRPVE